MPAPPLFSSSIDDRITSVSGTNENHTDHPILLISACPRCGSNYLEALLMLHPQCRKASIQEDFFLANGATLISFCQSVVESWDHPHSDVPTLAAHLGKALLCFAAPAGLIAAPINSTRLILRSPTSEGIAAVATLFPNARVVILVRDGPATVESGRRSFGWWYEDAMLRWRKSVWEILTAASLYDVPPWHIVRFEDLVAAPASEIEKIIRFVDLDAALYPFDRIGEIPVIGSSSYSREHGDAVHWRPMPKDSSFDPRGRAQSWPRRRTKRFSWLAGKELRRFGYEASPLSPFDRIWNVALDGWHLLRRAIVRLVVSRRIELRLFNDRRRRYLSWRHIRIVT